MDPYDPFVANQMVNGLKQFILSHVDDCKLIHKDTKVNDSYQSIFEYGSDKIQVNRLKVHKYLGMTLEFTTIGQSEIIIWTISMKYLMTLMN